MKIQNCCSPLESSRQEAMRLVMEDFFIQFVDNQDCIQAIVNFHNRNKHLCLLRCTCGNVDLPTCVRDRSVVCQKCNKVWWLTATTVFSRARDLRPYMATIKLMEIGIKVLSRDLVEMFGIALSTAFVIVKKITVVIAEYMKDNFLQVSSKDLTSVYCKRSIATEKFSHPASEVDAFDHQRDFVVEGVKAAQIGSSIDEPNSAKRAGTYAQSILQNLDPVATTIYEALSNEEILFDALAVKTNLPAQKINSQLTILELEGLVDCLSGNFIRRRHTELDEPISTVSSRSVLDTTILQGDHSVVVQSLSAHIKDFHQGSSRKYIQLYAADFWCLMDRERWGNGALLTACLRSKSVAWREILAYVSPVYIKLFPASASVA